MRTVMRLIGTDKIKGDGRDYLILVDNGTEGISVWNQYLTIHEALDAMAKGIYGNCTLVKLVQINGSER